MKKIASSLLTATAVTLVCFWYTDPQQTTPVSFSKVQKCSFATPLKYCTGESIDGPFYVVEEDESGKIISKIRSDKYY